MRRPIQVGIMMHHPFGLHEKSQQIFLLRTTAVIVEVFYKQSLKTELDQDNLKADLRVFGNLVKEIERKEAVVTIPEQGDYTSYKILL